MNWKTPRPSDYLRPGWSSPNLTVLDDVVISADRQSGPGQRLGKDQFAAGGFSTGDLVAFSAVNRRTPVVRPLRRRRTRARGRIQPGWSACGMARIWRELRRTTAPFAISAPENCCRNARSPTTGQTQHHHRCYQDKATLNYILAGRTGVEFIDLKTGEITPHNWVRGSCKFGILPSYGLLYTPPDQCGCYIESRLTGFHALAPKRSSESDAPQTKARPPRERTGLR